MDLTKKDLDHFKKDLLAEIRMMMLSQKPLAPRRWLKSHEVIRILKVAPGTLHNMRNNGTLPFVRIGAVMYYDIDDINKMLEIRKTNPIVNDSRTGGGDKNSSPDYDKKGSDKLKKYLVEQAKFFLDRAGEFYPFGAVIGNDGSVIPLGVQLEDDHPRSQEVVEILENAVINKLKNKETTLVGIGTDVYYRPFGTNERRSSIQLRILRADGESTDFYLPYKKEGRKMIYEDILSEKGTLNL